MIDMLQTGEVLGLVDGYELNLFCSGHPVPSGISYVSSRW